MDDFVLAGPWGGDGGSEWKFRAYGGRICGFIITTSTDCVWSLEFLYIDKNGTNTYRTGQYGTTGPDHPPPVTFHEDEYITEIGGTVGPFSGMTVITSLCIKTNRKPYEYGYKNGTEFSQPVTKGKFDGFFGNAGDVIDSFGAVLVP